MADKAIVVAVLEDDFASLVGLGFPLSLSIQLQESCMTLNKALWTAKFTNSGFSVGLFWPAPELMKDKHQSRRKRRRRRAKATKLVPATTNVNDKFKPSTKPLSPPVKPIGLLVAKGTRNNATCPATSSQNKHYCTPSPTPRHSNTTESDPKNGNDSDAEKEQPWTKVSHRRRKVRLETVSPCAFASKSSNP